MNSTYQIRRCSWLLVVASISDRSPTSNVGDEDAGAMIRHPLQIEAVRSKVHEEGGCAEHGDLVADATHHVVCGRGSSEASRRILAHKQRVT
eukprot:227402-Prymnesium_polylepis.1